MTTDSGRPVPGRRAVLAVAVPAVLVLAVALVSLDVARVRVAAARAETALDAGLDALARGDIGAASARLGEVSAHVDRARAGTDGWGWRVVRQLPGVREDLDTARAAVLAADAATDVAHGLVAPLAALTREDGTTHIRDADGRLDLQPVAAAAADVADLDVAVLAEALVELEGTDPAGLHPAVVRGRAATLRQGRRLQALAEDVRVLADVLPSFLGLEEPREYFLAMQNVAELRGTGGLIGFFATLRVGEGRMELTQPEKYEVLDQVTAQGDTPAIRPETLPAGYLDRYGQFDPTTFLANANLDPHLPTVATVLLNLYEAQRGRRLDGVIAIDPIGLAYTHAPIGPVQLPDGTPTGSMPRSIPPAQLARVLMVDAYDVLGGDSPQRKQFLAAVAETAFRGVASGEWSALAMARSLAVATGGGHLQLYSRHAGEQRVFRRLGLAGELDVPEGQDLLAVTAVNSAGNKMDVHVGHAMVGVIRLEEDGGRFTRTVDLRVTVDNPLPTSGRDVYIIGAHRPNLGFREAFTDRRGLNRTWFTVWAPGSTTPVAVTGPRGNRDVTPGVDRLRGLVAVDHVLETPSMTERGFSIEMTGTAAVSGEGRRRSYTLRLHRQAKGIPDRIDLDVVAPDGWRVVGATSSGGGADPLFGVHGEPGPVLAVERGEGAVRIHGDVTRTVTLEVVLERAGSG